MESREHGVSLKIKGYMKEPEQVKCKGKRRFESNVNGDRTPGTLDDVTGSERMGLKGEVCNYKSRLQL